MKAGSSPDKEFNPYDENNILALYRETEMSSEQWNHYYRNHFLLRNLRSLILQAPVIFSFSEERYREGIEAWNQLPEERRSWNSLNTKVTNASKPGKREKSTDSLRRSWKQYQKPLNYVDESQAKE